MKIIHASSECVPFAKTGGLADVVSSLSKELARKGEEVYVFLPLYGIIPTENLKLVKKNISLHFAGQNTFFNILESKTEEGVSILFIDYPPLFGRPGIYGINNTDFPDNAIRYLYFARAVIEGCLDLGLAPDVFHCHDWQASFIVIYLKTLYSNNNLLNKAASLLTIHNLSFQGLFEPNLWEFTYLDNNLFNMEGLEFYGKINFLKGGIIFADLITTVSPTYSREIQSEEQGCGLEGLLKKRSNVLYGVLNGIDDKIWDPSSDIFIPYNYSIDDLSGKYLCKKELLKECHFPPDEDVPIIGMITRLTPQKGIDLLLEALNSLVLSSCRMIILGSGMKEYEEKLIYWSRRYPEKICVRIEFNERLAHLIEAGADMFLMPSKYEPCGLNQMYSLKYGTIPIVRDTGGLADTVIDISKEPKNGTGFKFYEYSSLGLLGAVDAALSIFPYKQYWQEIMLRGMKEDFSWNKSADSYLKLYKRAIEMKF